MIVFAVMGKGEEKMPRHIDAELLKAEFTGDFIDTAYSPEFIKAIIDGQPTADVQEVRHGRWISISSELGGYKWAYYCSECDWVDGYPFNDRHKYCPHCGAKMDGNE